jgi:hypothetical protein
VHGSILAVKGLAYFVAGRSSHVDGGLHLYALDAKTGAVRHHRTRSGPEHEVAKIKGNSGLAMGWLPDILASDGESVFMRMRRFGLDLAPMEGRPAMLAVTGFLDDAYFKRVPWRYPGIGWGRLIVHDDAGAYVLRMFDTLRALDHMVYFTPGKKGYRLFAKEKLGGKSRWDRRIRVRARAMLATPDRLVVAGPPDVVDPRDPLAAFEGRKGGVVHVVDATSGKTLQELALSSPPVFNGIAAARGRLILTCEDGTIVCLQSGHPARPTGN